MRSALVTGATVSSGSVGAASTGAGSAAFAAAVANVGRNPTDVHGYFAGRMSTATKTNTPILDIPQSVTVLTRQQLDDRNSHRPGKSRWPTSPASRWRKAKRNRDQITIRGQNTTADFYIDGIRDDAEYYRDLYNIQAVEVLKGPSALIFGRGGGGGVVNRVTKKADGETINELRVVGGSFGRKRITADFGRAVTDTIAVRLNALYEHSYGYRDFDKLERWGVNPAVSWKPFENTFVLFNYEHFRDRRTADRGVPSFGGFQFLGENDLSGLSIANPAFDAFFGVGNPSVRDVNYARINHGPRRSRDRSHDGVRLEYSQSARLGELRQAISEHIPGSDARTVVATTQSGAERAQPDHDHAGGRRATRRLPRADATTQHLQPDGLDL